MKENNFNRYIESLQGSESIRLMQKAEELRHQGYEVINLSGGEPDFATPELVVSKAVQALRQGHTHYTVGPGLFNLRKKISEKLHVENNIICSEDEVIVTPGAKYAVYLAVAALLNPGDEVLIFTPAWVSYGPIVQACGGKPIFCPLDYEDNYEIKGVNILPYLTDKTKMIIINYPNNPTGRVLTEKEARILTDIIEEKGLYVISDEIYEKIVFDHKKSFSLASIPAVSDRVITINGFSKGAAMTGWRIGYAAGPRKVIDVMKKMFLHTITGVSTFIQEAAEEVFSCGDEIEKMRKEYETRRNYMVEQLKKIPGIECRAPQGTFYLWICFKTEKSSKEVCRELLEQCNIVAVSGEAYREITHTCVRFSIAKPISDLEKVIEKLKEFYCG